MCYYPTHELLLALLALLARQEAARLDERSEAEQARREREALRASTDAVQKKAHSAIMQLEARLADATRRLSAERDELALAHQRAQVCVAISLMRSSHVCCHPTHEVLLALLARRARRRSSRRGTMSSSTRRASCRAARPSMSSGCSRSRHGARTPFDGFQKHRSA